MNFSQFKLLQVFFTSIFYMEIVVGEQTLKTSKMFHIAGVFPRMSSAPALAARMAIEDINNFASATGPNTFNRVTLMTGETRCQSQLTAALMYKLMTTGPPISVLIAGCPEDCELIFRAAPVWNAVTICYGISSTELFPYYYGSSGSVVPKIPTLFSAQPQLSSIKYALVKFIRHFGWKRVAVFNQDYGNYYHIAHELVVALEHHEVEVLETEASSDEELAASFDRIEAEGVRIILTLGTEYFSRQILCQIYHRHLFDSQKYVWLFLGSHHKEWFLQTDFPSSENDDPSVGHEVVDQNNVTHTTRSLCTSEQLTQAADGHFNMKPVLWNSNVGIKTISGMKVDEFKSRILGELRETGENKNSDFDEAPLAYDSIWAAYLALNRTSTFECSDGKLPCDFAYDNYGFETHLAMVKDLRFQGVSGQVSFNERGERSIRDACIKIVRFKNNEQITVGWHYNFNNTFVWKDPQPFGTDIPRDGMDFDEGTESMSTIPPPGDTTSTTTPNCNNLANELRIERKFLLISLFTISYKIIVFYSGTN